MTIRNSDNQSHDDLTPDEAGAFRDFYDYGTHVRDIVARRIIHPYRLYEILGLDSDSENMNDLTLLYQRAMQARGK